MAQPGNHRPSLFSECAGGGQGDCLAGATQTAQGRVQSGSDEQVWRTNRYTILFSEPKKRERKRTKHKEIEVHSAQTAPGTISQAQGTTAKARGTTATGTENNSHQHEEQSCEAQRNESTPDRP